MSEQTQAQPAKTPWHRFLAKALELSVGLERISVESEVPISSEPPRVDIVLLRRESATRTAAQRAMLPDGVRDIEAQSILLEFKYSESLTQAAIVQALAYDHFFRVTRNLKREEVQTFILCAKTPQTERLTSFEYQVTDVPGIYRSPNIYVAHLPLKTIWSLPEGASMNEILTPERVMEIGEEWKQIFLRHLSPEELDAYIDPAYKRSLLTAGREEGREEGEFNALARTIIQILQRRFGDVPPTLSNTLQQSTLARLNELVNAALDAATLDEFQAQL